MCVKQTLCKRHPSRGSRSMLPQNGFIVDIVFGFPMFPYETAKILLIQDDKQSGIHQCRLQNKSPQFYLVAVEKNRGGRPGTNYDVP